MDKSSSGAEGEPTRPVWGASPDAAGSWGADAVAGWGADAVAGWGADAAGASATDAPSPARGAGSASSSPWSFADERSWTTPGEPVQAWTDPGVSAWTTPADPAPTAPADQTSTASATPLGADAWTAAASHDAWAAPSADASWGDPAATSGPTSAPAPAAAAAAPALPAEPIAPVAFGGADPSAGYAAQNAAAFAVPMYATTPAPVAEPVEAPAAYVPIAEPVEAPAAYIPVAEPVEASAAYIPLAEPVEAPPISYTPTYVPVAEPAEARPTSYLPASHAVDAPSAYSAGATSTADASAIRRALHHVVESGASDLHISADAPPMIRIDGGLRPIEGALPWDAATVTAHLHSIMTEQQRETFERELELDFAYPLSDESRFRVNVYLQREAMGAAFRLIPTEIKTLTQLGVPDSVQRFSKLPRGLVLVTGPTGSGKSTTLAALIDLVNSTRADHIMTVEDPIEFMHGNKRSLVNQREVGQDTKSFSAALKHVLRQDPDVILIGEMRDLETISTALTAAETGHLVFATLHTQSAAQTIDRIIDVFPPHQQDQIRSQLAATLQGVVCQTLVKRASGKGRVVATEVMVTTPAVANLIREGKTYQVPSALQAGRELGMHSLDQHLAELVNAGTVTNEAALEKVHDPEGFQRLVKREDAPLQDMGVIDFGDSFSRGS